MLGKYRVPKSCSRRRVFWLGIAVRPSKRAARTAQNERTGLSCAESFHWGRTPQMVNASLPPPVEAVQLQ